MKSLERILTAVDFSDFTIPVLQKASHLVQRVKGKLSVLHVVSQTPFEGHFFGPPHVELMNQIEAGAREELDKQVKQSVTQGVEITTEVKMGVPYVDILRYAKQHKAQFLVLGSHGRKGWGRLLLGSVSETLLRKSECPVWLVRKGATAPRRLLLLTDLSVASRTGVELGFYLGRLFEASLHLVHVHEPVVAPEFVQMDLTEIDLKMKETAREEFSKWVEEFKSFKTPFTNEFIEGKAFHTLEEYLQQQAFDLVVLSTHGRSGLFHKYLGSLATFLVRHSPCDVVTTRPEGFRFKEIV